MTIDIGELTINQAREIASMFNGGNGLSGLGDTWSACREGAPFPATQLEWSDTLLDGESVTYKDAEKAVKQLGEGWRLPTRQELESILDLSRHDPAIDPEKFPDTKSSWYWTSTPCAWREDAVWCVDFDYGAVNFLHRSSDCCVRAVRSGQ